MSVEPVEIEPLEIAIQQEVTELQDELQRLLDELVESGAELGLQAAVYVEGKLVADVWAGDMERGAGAGCVDGDTLFTSWSTTKGFVATCLHILADRNQVDYNSTVAQYWPAFGCKGKEAITVRQALNHTAGIPQLPAGTNVDSLSEWDGMCAAIAELQPLWEPGVKAAYHALTFGWIIGEVIRRVDGRSISEFAREELCEPLGISDFYLGIPSAVDDRVATLVDDVAPKAGSGLREQALPLHTATAETMNLPSVRRAAIPGSGGIMNARAIARHYAALAAGGELEGVRILSAERVAEATALQTDARDEVMEMRNRKALGYMLGGEGDGGDVRIGSTGSEFGHPGHGGSIGFADPHRALAVGFTKNLMTNHADRRSSSAYLVGQVARDWVDGSSK